MRLNNPKRFNSKGLSCLMLVALSGTSLATDNSIAYLREQGDTWQVWLYDAQVDRHEQLTDDAIDKTRLSWNQERTKVLVNRNNGTLFWLNVISKEIEEAPLKATDILDGKLSYDDQWVAYSEVTYSPKPNYNLWRIKLSDSTREQLTNQVELQSFPSWSKDGKDIVYISGSATEGYNIWELDVKSKSQTQLTFNGGYSFDPVLSANGDLLYSSNDAGNYDLWLKTPGNEKAIPLTTDADFEGAPSWSPDGSRIVYEVLRGSNRQLWIMNRDGSGAKAITPEDTSSRAPAWSK